VHQPRTHRTIAQWSRTAGTRHGVGWEITGAQMSVYENALKYARERLQFGKPIGSYSGASGEHAGQHRCLSEHAGPLGAAGNRRQADGCTGGNRQGVLHGQGAAPASEPAQQPEGEGHDPLPALSQADLPLLHANDDLARQEHDAERDRGLDGGSWHMYHSDCRQAQYNRMYEREGSDGSQQYLGGFGLRLSVAQRQRPLNKLDANGVRDL
jgi:hypothetical protein